jgi:hypothetical protein
MGGKRSAVSLKGIIRENRILIKEEQPAFPQFSGDGIPGVAGGAYSGILRGMKVPEAKRLGFVPRHRSRGVRAVVMDQQVQAQTSVPKSSGQGTVGLGGGEVPSIEHQDGKDLVQVVLNSVVIDGPFRFGDTHDPAR